MTNQIATFTNTLSINTVTLTLDGVLVTRKQGTGARFQLAAKRHFDGLGSAICWIARTQRTLKTQTEYTCDANYAGQVANVWDNFGSL